MFDQYRSERWPRSRLSARGLSQVQSLALAPPSAAGWSRGCGTMSTATPSTPTVDVDATASFLRVLVDSSPGCVEIRLLDASIDPRTRRVIAHEVYKSTVSVWGDNIDALVQEIARVEGVSCYVTVSLPPCAISNMEGHRQAAHLLHKNSPPVTDGELPKPARKPTDALGRGDGRKPIRARRHGPSRGQSGVRWCRLGEVDLVLAVASGTQINSIGGPRALLTDAGNVPILIGTTRMNCRDREVTSHLVRAEYELHPWPIQSES